MKRTGRARRKTRHKLSKHYREKGKISISEFFKEIKIGQQVVLKASPSYQKALYHARYHGRHGVVVGKRGSCYEVKIKDGSKDKLLIIHPVHLRIVKTPKT